MSERYPIKHKEETDSYILFIIILLVLGYWVIKKYLVNFIYIFYWLISIVLAIIFIFVLTYMVKRIIKQRNQPDLLRPDLWANMDGRKFEDQIVLWLKRYGYKTVVKTEYYDQGVDILASNPGNLVGIQVKRSAKPVGVNAIRAVVAGTKVYGCNSSMVITNNNFTAQAISLAKVNNTQLINGAKLLSIL